MSFKEYLSLLYDKEKGLICGKEFRGKFSDIQVVLEVEWENQDAKMDDRVQDWF